VFSGRWRRRLSPLEVPSPLVLTSAAGARKSRWPAPGDRGTSAVTARPGIRGRRISRVLPRSRPHGAVCARNVPRAGRAGNGATAPAVGILVSPFSAKFRLRPSAGSAVPFCGSIGARSRLSGWSSRRLGVRRRGLRYQLPGWPTPRDAARASRSAGPSPPCQPLRASGSPLTSARRTSAHVEPAPVAG
jgi:hypothetical protein